MRDFQYNQREIVDGYSTSMVVKETGVSFRQLYYWEGLGMVHPRLERFGTRLLRRYTQKDISLLRGVVEYLKEGYNLRAAARKAMDKEKSFLGGEKPGGLET